MIMAAKEVVGMEVRGGVTNEPVFWKYEMASRQLIIREGRWWKSRGESNDSFDDGDDDSDNDDGDGGDDDDDDSDNDDEDSGNGDGVPAKPCLESDAEFPSWQGRGPDGNQQ